MLSSFFLLPFSRRSRNSTPCFAKDIIPNYFDQSYSIKEIKEFNEGISKLNYSSCQEILRRLDRSFQAFFRRIKKGEVPGFPRFKGKDRFDSITYPVYGDGVKLKNGKIYVQNIGTVRIKKHREIQGIIKTVTFKRETSRFYVIFSCDEVPGNILPSTGKEVGIDMGIENFAVLSDRNVIENPRILKQSEEKLKEIQSKYSKSRSETLKKKLVSLHLKVRNRRNDFLHQASRWVINHYDRIFIEDLKIKEMMDGNFSSLNKSISDVAWSRFFGFLSYKAEDAGREVGKVNPKGTSQVCSNCGAIVPKTLNDRVHFCPRCGFHTSRDHNSSLNILRLGRSQRLGLEAIC